MYDTAENLLREIQNTGEYIYMDPEHGTGAPPPDHRLPT